MGIRVAAFAAALACAGCGLDESGLVPLDGGGPLVDANPPADGSSPTDGGAPDVADAAPPIEAGPCDDDANDCTPPEVPTGWTPVAYVENPTAACAAPFSVQDDYVTSVGTGNAACSCTCTKTNDPSCTTGKVDNHYSTSNPGCGSQGQSLTFNNGACVGLTANLADYNESTALPPTGGACTGQTAATGTLTTTPARLCGPDPACTSAACGGYAPPGYSACIVADNDQPCPTGSSFVNKHAIAKSASPTCADCGTGCALTGSCLSPVVHFFSDGQCATEIVALPSDGTTCSATNHGGDSVRGATYTATPSFNCQATGTTSLKIAYTTQRTVCCR